MSKRRAENKKTNTSHMVNFIREKLKVGFVRPPLPLAIAPNDMFSCLDFSSHTIVPNATDNSRAFSEPKLIRMLDALQIDTHFIPSQLVNAPDAEISCLCCH